MRISGGGEMKKSDQILAVRPQSCHGPGWSNWPIWVYIKNREGVIREECIQPDDRTEVMAYLHDPYESMTNTMIAQCYEVLGRKR